MVGEDQENTSIYVDSVFESGQVEDGYEKIALGCEEQVVLSDPTELRFPSSDEDSCSEILEKDGQIEAISGEVIDVAVEVEDVMEYEKATDIITIEDDDVAENEETVFMNPEVACANEVKVKDNLQGQFLNEEKQIDDFDDDMISENCEGDLSNKPCQEIPILREDYQQTQCNNKQLEIGEEEEEAVKADCVDVVSIEEIRVNEVCEETPSQAINEEEEEEKEEVQERVTTELLNKIEIEIPRTQVIEAVKVDDNETLVVVREEDPERKLTNKQEKIEMNGDDEIPVVQKIQEEEELQDSLIREAKMMSNNEKNESSSTSSIKQDEYMKGGVWKSE